MKKLFLTSTFLFTLVLSTSLVFAGFTPLGAQCTPDSTTVNQTCPYCPGQTGAPGIHLKWKLTGNFSQPKCTLFCDRADVDDECKHSRYGGEDSNGVATSTNPNPAKFKPVDDTYVLKPEDTDIYKVGCMESDPEMPTPRLVQFSPEMKVTSSCAEACEVPFLTTAENLKNNRKAIITEKGIGDWCNFGGTKDNVKDSKGLGSGDWPDLTNLISSLHTECHQLVTIWQNPTDPLDFDYVHDYLSSLSKNYKPIIVTFFWKNPEWTPSSTDIQPVFAHAVVGLKLVDKSAKSFSLDIFDPNQPNSVVTVECSRVTTTFLLEGQPVKIAVAECKGISASLGKESYISAGGWLDYCSNPIREKPTEWLIEKINQGGGCENRSPESNPKGVCAGASALMINLACHGDLVGKDFHPNDGNTVGHGCDANHYPTSKHAQATPTSWLANLWSALNSFKFN